MMQVLTARSTRNMTALAVDATSCVLQGKMYCIALARGVSGDAAVPGCGASLASKHEDDSSTAQLWQPLQ